MAFRALDTLLEKVVLVLALIGVWSLAPDALWGGIPGPQRHARPDEALVFLARLLPPVGIVIARLPALGRGGRARRRLPGRRAPGRDVAARHDGRADAPRPR